MDGLLTPSPLQGEGRGEGRNFQSVVGSRRALMGYFRKPIRRASARKAKLAHLEPARDISPSEWRQCNPSSLRSDRGYVRFVVDHPSEGRRGLFRSSELIEDDIELPAGTRTEFRTVLRWFNKKLTPPRRLPQNAVCWFRADAADFIKQMRTLVELYRLADRQVLMQSTRRPGRIVYRDAFQVAAVPHRNGATSTSEV